MYNYTTTPLNFGQIPLESNIGLMPGSSTPQYIEEGQRLVNRIQPTITTNVPPEVEEYRRLSKEERSLRITNPRLLSLMAMRCTSCKKVIKQLSIEEALRSGKTLREVLDEQDYIRICCRKQIQSEPVVVNIQKEMDSQRRTINRMNNLSINSTAAALMGRSPAINPLPSGIRIMNEAPPGFSQPKIQIIGHTTNTTQQEQIYFPGSGESFLESRQPAGDAYNMYMGQLDGNGSEDEY
jgi:DNA-directed RNA polymerase subunit N (RpoN/RPB10)